MKRRDRYDSLIQYYAGRYGLDWRLVRRLLEVESGMNPRAVNRRSGAMGLAQFMPATWAEWAGRVDAGAGRVWLATNPEDAIHLCCAYLQWLKRRFRGRAQRDRLALAAYNWGIGNVQRMLKEEASNWPAVERRLPRETRRYVRRVMA